MANVKRGNLTAARDWARHLRPDWKRLFWSRERQAHKSAIADMAGEEAIRTDGGLLTMDEAYGDGSVHESCQDCGYCVTCGDCDKHGCGRDAEKESK